MVVRAVGINFLGLREYLMTKKRIADGLIKGLKEAVEHETAFPHYWICSECAKERGGSWPKGHVATFSQMLCKYCKGDKQGEEFIAPYIDYNWPNLKTSHLRD